MVKKSEAYELLTRLVTRLKLKDISGTKPNPLILSPYINPVTDLGELAKNYKMYYWESSFADGAGYKRLYGAAEGKILTIHAVNIVKISGTLTMSALAIYHDDVATSDEPNVGLDYPFYLGEQSSSPNFFSRNMTSWKHPLRLDPGMAIAIQADSAISAIYKAYILYTEEEVY